MGFAIFLVILLIGTATALAVYFASKIYSQVWIIICTHTHLYTHQNGNLQQPNRSNNLLWFIFTTGSSSTSDDDAAIQKEVEINGELRITNFEYKPDYDNPSSDAFRDFEEMFCKDVCIARYRIFWKLCIGYDI